MQGNFVAKVQVVVSGRSLVGEIHGNSEKSIATAMTRTFMNPLLQSTSAASAMSTTITNDGKHRKHGQNQSAALWPRLPTTQQQLSRWMAGKQMPLDHGPAIRHTKDKRLRPIPRCMEAERPPERTLSSTASGRRSPRLTPPTKVQSQTRQDCCRVRSRREMKDPAAAVQKPSVSLCVVWKQHLVERSRSARHRVLQVSPQHDTPQPGLRGHEPN